MSDVAGNTENTGLEESTIEPSSNQDVDKAIEENEASKATSANTLKKAIELRKKYRLKVDGEEFEEELDLNNDEAIKELLQLKKGYSKRRDDIRKEKESLFTEKKQMKDLWDQMQNKDPFAHVRTKQEFRDILEKELLKFMEKDGMTPEQRELAELREYRAEMARREEEFKMQREAEELSKKEQALVGKFQQDLIQASEKAGLGKNPEIIKLMAKKMKQSIQYDLGLTADDIADEIKEEVQGMYKTILKNGDENFLTSFFDQEVVNKIRKADLKKLQEKQLKSLEKTEKQETKKSNNERPQSLRDWISSR
jgi:hypothetical protein